MPVPDFSPGEIWTAGAADSIGLWLVKSQPVGTGVSSVTVTGAFSADFDNYLITYEGGIASSQASVGLQLGSTTANYYSAGLGYTWAGLVSNFNLSNTANFGIVGYATTTFSNVECSLFGPFATRRTTMRMNTASSTQQLVGSGYQDSATSFTAFTFLFGAATVTGGTIRVYGYRN
jgi:hypothetical protein